MIANPPSSTRRLTRSSTVKQNLKKAEDEAKGRTVERNDLQRKGPLQPKQYVTTTSANRIPRIHSPRFHLIQEQVAHNLYKLLVAAILWNRTKGIQARPVFLALVARFPSPEQLAGATESDLANLIRPLGLHNTRARRLISFAQAWVQCPPTKHRRYRTLRYPFVQSGRDIGPKEVLGKDDSREGWEIAHLPGIGPYALDSFRIFHRDEFRSLATDWEGGGALAGFEPEWKRVMPSDKELKAYIRWKWLKEGWIWDPSSGRKVAASPGRMKTENARTTSLSPENLLIPCLSGE